MHTCNPTKTNCLGDRTRVFFSTDWVCAVTKFLESPQCTNKLLYRKLFGGLEYCLPSHSGVGSIVFSHSDCGRQFLFTSLQLQKLCLLETTMGVFPSIPTQGCFYQPTHPLILQVRDRGQTRKVTHNPTPAQRKRLGQLINSLPLKRVFSKSNLSKTNLPVTI